PAILGHEGAGIVASVGEAVSGIRVGDHVVLSYAACHDCENCLSNHPSACEDFNTLNFGGRRGDGTTPYRLGDQDLSLFFGQSSFSQYVVTRASNAVVVDPEVDLTLLGPLGCGIQTGSGTVLNR
ncbi:alcohol dehydrogenase catalytic domain-containing protein, partial [Pseudomonas aeruginosa]|nr:alcohol dehydrogenase catalytic domain-containing protein [Pseudomonas aeruginosa]